MPLVLYRKDKESVIIEVPPSEKTQVIEVILLSSKSHSAKLGFTADRSINIARKEIAAFV